MNTNKICLIGYGYWGKNLLRNLIQVYGSTNVCVVEVNENSRNQFLASHDSVPLYYSLSEAMQTEKINAVVIATPTSTHFDLAKIALELGAHVLVEKPITTSTNQLKQLSEIAAKKNLVIMVDHIFLYNPVVRKLKEYIDKDYVGKINYIDCTRINLGIYQNDTNVIWDLACHDISIVNFLVKEKPEYVRALGRNNPQHNLTDIAYTFLYYASGLLVQINSSWASPLKMRKMIIGGDKRMVIYDDVEPTNKLTIYEYGKTDTQQKTTLTDYRLGDIIIPKYSQEEPLENVIREFQNCINGHSKPITDDINAFDVVRVLELAQQSLNTDGAKLKLY